MTNAVVPIAAVKVSRDLLLCDQRQLADLADICSSTCDPSDDDSCPEASKCCATGCGFACVAAVLPGHSTHNIKTVSFELTMRRLKLFFCAGGDAEQPCTLARDEALLSLSIDPTKATVVPFCDARGLWERVQCNMYLGVCWCVVPLTGSRVAGTQVRGTPQCDDDSSVESLDSDDVSSDDEESDESASDESDDDVSDESDYDSIDDVTDSYEYDDDVTDSYESDDDVTEDSSEMDGDVTEYDRIKFGR